MKSFLPGLVLLLIFSDGLFAQKEKLKFRTEGYYYSVDSTFGFKSYEMFFFLDNDTLIRGLNVGIETWSPQTLEELDSIMILYGEETIRSSNWAKYEKDGTKIYIMVNAGLNDAWKYIYSCTVTSDTIEFQEYEMFNSSKNYHRKSFLNQKYFFRALANVPIPHRKR